MACRVSEWALGINVLMKLVKQAFTRKSFKKNQHDTHHNPSLWTIFSCCREPWCYITSKQPICLLDALIPAPPFCPMACMLWANQLLLGPRKTQTEVRQNDIRLAARLPLGAAVWSIGNVLHWRFIWTEKVIPMCTERPVSHGWPHKLQTIWRRRGRVLYSRINQG